MPSALLIAGIGMMGLRIETQFTEQRLVPVFFWIRRGEKLATVKDRIGPRHKTHGLGLFIHLLATSGQPHMGTRHHNARYRNGADKIERVDILIFR